MEDLRRREKFHSKALGKEVELVELSYRAQAKIMQAYRDGEPYDVGPIMVKYGVAEYHDATLDEIADSLPLGVIGELSDAVSDFSGIDEDHEKK